VDVAELVSGNDAIADAGKCRPQKFFLFGNRKCRPPSQLAVPADQVEHGADHEQADYRDQRAGCVRLPYNCDSAFVACREYLPFLILHFGQSVTNRIHRHFAASAALEVTRAFQVGRPQIENCLGPVNNFATMCRCSRFRRSC